MSATTQWNFLTGDTEKDRRNVEILLDSVEGLYGPQEISELMRSAVDRAIRVTGAERGILLLSDDEGRLETRVARTAEGEALPLDTRYSQSVVRKVWNAGEPSLTIDTADEHTGSLSDSILAMRLLSVMGVPLPSKDGNLGVLYVDSTAKVKEFTESDFSVFQALGGLIALAVQNARLLAAKAVQDRLERELLVAQQIQQRLLPSDLPQPPGYELAASNWPCDETSGDYYDAIPYGDGRIALVVGDVSGHGLGPALIMASTRAQLHATLALRPDLDEVIATANRFLERDIPDNAFMSFFIGSLHPEERTFEYVSAGHNPPLLWSPSGEIEELPKTGPVLGVLPDADYTCSPPRALQPGSVLMLFTDGIFEAQDERGEMYGEDRLAASFAAHAGSGAPAEAVRAGVLGDLRRFVGAHPFDDDVTCLVLRVV